MSLKLFEFFSPKLRIFWLVLLSYMLEIILSNQEIAQGKLISPLTLRYESVGKFNAFSLSGYVRFIIFGISFVVHIYTVTHDV